MSSSFNIDLFFMFLPPFDSSQCDESNELKIVKNGSVVFDIAIIYFLLSLGYLDHFLTSSISTISTISTLFRPYFDPEFSISVSCIAVMPGPSEPKLYEINYYLHPIINQLSRLW